MSRRFPAFDPLRGAGVLILLILWEAISLFVSPAILPPPTAVYARIVSDFFDAPALSYYGVQVPNLYGNLLYTIENVFLATVSGALIGILLGAASSRFAFVRAIVDPIMATAGTVPILIVAPFLLIIFGVGRANSLCLVAFFILVITYIYAQRACINVDPLYEEWARTLGATQMKIVMSVLTPAALPGILGGLRIALAGAWGMEAIAELLGAQMGLGKVIEVLSGATDAEGILATLVILGISALLADLLMSSAVHFLTRWQKTSR
jgi:ABC-type nitrate/sulfonate/bicarbonate transport system permease component